METIFFGNGINRLVEDFPSWSDLLQRIAGKTKMHNIPNNLLQYESIIANMYNVELPKSFKGFKSIGAYDNRLELKAKENTRDVLIADGLPANCLHNPIFRLLFEKKADHYITTNYDNYLLGVFENNGYVATIDDKKREEKIYNVRRHYIVKNAAGETSMYWPIHGEIRNPKSIMLGLDHYCGSIAKIDRYLKEDDYRSTGKEDRMGFLDRLSNTADRSTLKILTWVDLFFLSNIHIIGFSFGYDEIDLWWILNRRHRAYMLDNHLVTNEITFYGTPGGEGQAELFEDFGVTVKRTITDYLQIYREQLDTILPLAEQNENRVPDTYQKLLQKFGHNEFRFVDMADALPMSRARASRVLKNLIEDGKCQKVGNNVRTMKFRLI